MTLVVIAIDNLLCSLGLDYSARLAWLQQKVVSRKEVGEEYRRKRDRLIVGLRDPGQFEPAVGEVLARRRATLNHIATRFAALHLDRALTQPLSKLYESYVHMHCNRLSADNVTERRALDPLLRARGDRRAGGNASRQPKTISIPTTRRRFVGHARETPSPGWSVPSGDSESSGPPVPFVWIHTMYYVPPFRRRTLW
jgi:hypothetical protein